MSSIRKVCVVITARPSYSRVKTLLQAITDNPKLELQLVVAASALLERYGNAVKQIEEDGFRISRKVYSVLDGETPLTSAKTTGLGLIELSSVFDDLGPDLVVTIADRYETISTAIAASYMNIPLVHIQGGEVTGSIDEKVRHAITKLADIHFVSTACAATRVIKMGERPESVFNTGCPSIDLARDAAMSMDVKMNPFDKYGGVGGECFDLEKGYSIVMQHPVTTEYQDARMQITETLLAIEKYGRSVFWFWPNVDAGSDATSKGIRAFRETHQPRNIRFFKNMSPRDFLVLLMRSDMIIGNSSVAIRECAYLGIPAVNIGSRQTGRERGKNVIDVPHEQEAILQAIKLQENHGKYESEHLYGDGYSGQRMADILTTVPLSHVKRLAY